MITQDDYFGKYADHPDATEGAKTRAGFLLQAVNALLLEAITSGVKIKLNPKTGTWISGTRNGGFRPKDCTEGRPNSSHKESRGIDVYDPNNELDNWITDEILVKYGLYREHPEDTMSWCHLTNRMPGSGKRTFKP